MKSFVPSETLAHFIRFVSAHIISCILQTENNSSTIKMRRKSWFHMTLPWFTNNKFANTIIDFYGKAPTLETMAHAKHHQCPEMMKVETSISAVTGTSLPSKKKPGVIVGAYELKETLGTGNFGKVRRGVHIKSGMEYAIKIVDTKIYKQELPGTLDIRREMSILRALSHPNIIHLHDVMTTSNRVYLVMDLASGGDFYQLISKHNALKEADARRYFRQLVDAIEYCHERGIYHRDLKPENLLLTENGVLKVTDFGFSAVRDHGRKLLQTNCGSVHYCAPEVWNRTQRGYEGAKSDAYSVGVVLYVLLCGTQPFNGGTHHELMQKVDRCNIEYPEELSGDAVDLLQKLIVRDPKERWSLSMVRRHPWFLAGSLDGLVLERMSECGEGDEDGEWEICEECYRRGCFSRQSLV